MESTLDEYDALPIRTDEQLVDVASHSLSPVGPLLNSGDDRGDEFTYPRHLSECDDPYYNELQTYASSSSLYSAQDIDDEPVDLENNRLIWLPPEPQFYDDYDEDNYNEDDYDEKKENHHSILVSLSSHCVPKGCVCEGSRLFCIEYYGNFDKPLGCFLRDNLFDQAYRCRSCEMCSEAHVQRYTHRQGTLTISVKKLTETTLPRGNEGKIWIWNRCLRCPRVNGFPPSTSRVLMSDAASGLSFGKFLELSFSDHADVSRVANCSHSLHHDCLRFYGLGEMVACFRYTSIRVHSVYLPPSKLVFRYENQQWIQNEVNQVVSRAELLFSVILNALTQMSQSRREITDLEDMLQKEKAEFEGSLSKILNQNGLAMIDIFEINRLRRQLLFQSYVWDHRLVYAATVISDNSPVDSDIIQDSSSTWFSMPFLNLYNSLNKNLLPFLNLNEYRAVYISSYCESNLQGGAHLLLPVGINDTVVPVYDDEPTSIISYALLSPDYVSQMSQSADSAMFQSFIVDFADDGRCGKVKYNVTCYYAKQFESLRRICCPSELDYIRSLSRCDKWGKKGGKSNVFFAKTLDERFIIKHVTKTEMESFNKFGPSYFKYLSESISSGSHTCLAKILGIYQVTKQMKRGKKVKMDVLVMENLLFGRNLARLYDLNGSSSSRYNPDSYGSNKTLLDLNLIESMPTSPIFVGNKAKRLLEMAVWNDTSFLASINVVDYSLLVGVDEDKHELVLGIIGFMRQYTWDKHLETWVNAFGIHGGPKNASPSPISPKQYKKRFRKAMTTYFHMVLDQWSPPPSQEGQRGTFHAAAD
ncbi:1-phosphatidylinositol-3-phosphate 5-kinase FAB1B-like [Rutidosis leptorrhynchoides]|uniref:1-phosphatidylinositol-3-phosphate 5-kinase FAB1B-like n=1 Tax=Rutidosis leptorrhynchoides TaxID=125765 RepID=UPI003A99FCA2